MSSSAAGHPHLFITLFGSRNETLIGELNMTGMTLPRKDTRGGSSSSASSTDDVGTAASASASFARSGYDSRGAAYYICIVILVYALAIAAFVISLARRRNTRDKYRLAHDQIVDCGLQRREEEGRRQGGCWRQRCSGSSEFPGIPSSSPWSSASSSSSNSSNNSGMAMHRRPDNLDLERPKVVTAVGLAPSTCVQVDPDEVITLVQVLPYSTRSSSSSSGGVGGGGSRDGSKTLDTDGGTLYNCDEDGDAAIISCDERLEDEEQQQQQKRFRWSMGPDGNIWILQVDDAVVIDDDATNNNDNTSSNNVMGCHDNTSSNNVIGCYDNASSNSAIGCQSQPKTDPVVGGGGGGDQGPNPPFRDAPLVQSCPSSATAAKGSHSSSSSGLVTVQPTKAADQQRRPKNHAAATAFSPVPKGYRPRGRSNSRERKARLFRSSDDQGSKVTSFLPTGSYHCSSSSTTAAERTMNCSLVSAREHHHWEEYHFLDPDPPFCLPLPLLSPHLMQKLIHVTSV